MASCLPPGRHTIRPHFESFFHYWKLNQPSQLWTFTSLFASEKFNYDGLPTLFALSVLCFDEKARRKGNGVARLKERAPTERTQREGCFPSDWFEFHRKSAEFYAGRPNVWWLEREVSLLKKFEYATGKQKIFACNRRALHVTRELCMKPVKSSREDNQAAPFEPN